jgi:hypothetical protein
MNKAIIRAVNPNLMSGSRQYIYKPAGVDFTFEKLAKAAGLTVKEAGELVVQLTSLVKVLDIEVPEQALCLYILEKNYPAIAFEHNRQNNTVYIIERESQRINKEIDKHEIKAEAYSLLKTMQADADLFSKVVRLFVPMTHIKPEKQVIKEIYDYIDTQPEAFVEAIKAPLLEERVLIRALCEFNLIPFNGTFFMYNNMVFGSSEKDILRELLREENKHIKDDLIEKLNAVLVKLKVEKSTKHKKESTKTISDVTSVDF